MTALMTTEASTRTRPITMAILAMGGEGGGVLADWLVYVAEHNDWYGQSTSVPGVAQRTGATVYYLEFFPRAGATAYPVLGTMPTPGEVDVVVASELMEAGRAITRGFITPERTTVVSSTSRTYAMPERTAMGEGRVDSEGLLEATRAASKRFVRGDFARIADDTGSVIRAVLFGAIASADVLPFTREQFEDAIRAGGKGIDASLRAFDKGFSVAAASERPTIEVTIGKRPDDYLDPVPVGPSAADIARATEDPSAMVGSRLTAQAARIARDFPAPARFNLVMGLKRTAEYQDIAYANLFLDRVATVAALDTDASARLTTETARYTALWMTYEDTIRVAFLKTRKKRFERVSGEARVSDEQLMEVREYLHPQIEEVTDTLPTALGRWMLRSKAANALIYKVTHKGLKLNTSSVWGYTMLYTMARMRPIRRRSLRFGLEQQRIETWLGLIRLYAPVDYTFACEIAECAQVIKGYGETHARGWASFEGLMAQVPALSADPATAATRLVALRKAALTN